MIKRIPSLQPDRVRSSAAAMISLRERGETGPWLIGELN
jgi:hypothetical protein